MILTLEQMLQYPHWEVVVVGLRHAQRVFQLVADQIPDRAIFDEALRQSVLATQGGVSSLDLEHHCEAAYRSASRLAASYRSQPGTSADLVAAGQTVHLIVDAVADFDLDSYEAVCSTYLAIKTSIRMTDRPLREHLNRDLLIANQLGLQPLPVANVLDAFGPLW